jgi:esterase/lipase superfamily enzyme
MDELWPAVVFGLVTAAAFFIYLIVWSSTRRISIGAKVALRVAAAAVLFAPIGLMIAVPPILELVATGGGLAGSFEAARAPTGSRDNGSHEESGSAVGDAEERRVRPKIAARRESEVRELPEAAAPAPEADWEPRAEAPHSLAPGASEKWDVVPVFYGTDRSRADDAKRINYSHERAKRLELGRALVTIPKSHEVPVIERPWVYKLPFTSIVIMQELEDPEKHFTLKDLTTLSEADFIKLVQSRLVTSARFKDHALIFVHGFNTTFDFAIYRAAQLAYDLKFDGAPFVYSWPSRGQISPTAYSYDRESAQQAEPHLRTFIELVAARSGAKAVSVIAHSMGNQVLLQVLRDLKRTAPEGVKISQVILAAPDVDRDGFEFLARQIQGVSQGVTMYAASNDRALVASRNFWGGIPRAGDVPPGGPVVVFGIDTIDVTATSTAIFSLNHSGYAEKSALLNDIGLLLQTGERPPDRRMPILQLVPTSNGAYWRYPGTG